MIWVSAIYRYILQNSTNLKADGGRPRSWPSLSAFALKFPFFPIALMYIFSSPYSQAGSYLRCKCCILEKRAFADKLLVYLAFETFRKRGSLLKERICFHREEMHTFTNGADEKGG